MLLLLLWWLLLMLAKQRMQWINSRKTTWLHYSAWWHGYSGLVFFFLIFSFDQKIKNRSLHFYIYRFVCVCITHGWPHKQNKTTHTHIEWIKYHQWTSCVCSWFFFLSMIFCRRRRLLFLHQDVVCVGLVCVVVVINII